MKAKMKTWMASLVGLTMTLGVNAQNAGKSFVHERSDTYEWPTDKAVLEKTFMPSMRWQMTLQKGKVIVKLPHGLKNKPVALKFNVKK